MKKINTYKVTITDRETYVMEEIMGTVNNRMWVQFCEMNGVEARGTRVVRATITKEERAFYNVK